MRRPTWWILVLSILVPVSALPANSKPAHLPVTPLNLGDTNADLVYTPLSPCRIIDTRIAGGFMVGGTTRSFKVAGTAGFDLQGGTAGGCGVPVGATAVLINFVAVSPDAIGNLKGSAYPNPIPTTGSIINYQLLNPALNIANAVGFPICDPTVSTCSADITLFTNGGGCHVVADVLGYFKRFPTEQTITSIVPGDGLSGGGTSGTVILGLNTSGATPGQALTFNGTNATWTTPAQGTITGVTAGSGLTGGGTSGTVSVAANFTAPGGMNGTATTVARGDHTHYARTVVVSPVSAVDPTQNGTALLNALAGISAPAATDPWLLKIEPGIYDLGAGTLTMKPYVDIEGSGEIVTTIRSTGFTLVPASNAELRLISVETTGTGSAAIIGNDASVSLYHVTARSVNSGGIAFGIYFSGVNGSAPRLEDVTIDCSGLGVVGYSEWPSNNTGLTITGVLHRVNIKLACATQTCNGIQNIYGSQLSADGLELSMNSSGGTITGIVSTSSGSGLTPSVKMRNFTMTLTQTTSAASRVISAAGATTTLRDGTIDNVSAGTANGIIDTDSSLLLTNCALNVNGTTSSTGVSNFSATALRSVVVENSTIFALTNTVTTSGGNFSVQISNSKLQGGPVVNGTIATQCLANIDETFTMFATTCP